MLCGRFLRIVVGNKELVLGRTLFTRGVVYLSTKWLGRSGNLQRGERKRFLICLVQRRRGSMASSDVAGSGLEVKDVMAGAEGNGGVGYAGEKFSSSKQNFGGENEVAGAGAAAKDYGFTRPEIHSEPLVGSVNHYERHVFLCHKDPESWPAQMEAADFDRLPRHLVAAIQERKNDMPKKTKFTICEGRDDGPDSSAGDVLIFPDMLLYRGLTHFDAESFVDDTLVQGKEWRGYKPESLSGSHIFVCAHANKDARCGVCGPLLVEKLREEIILRGLERQIIVRRCSHIGGHKYAGNLIVFSPNEIGKVSGHWYGYVVPEDIACILDQHIGKGEIVERLWRGQMGINQADQKLEQKKRQGVPKNEKKGCGCSQSQEQADGLNQGNGSACCQTIQPPVKQNGPVGQLTPTYSMGVRDGHLLFPLSDGDSDEDSAPQRFKVWGDWYITYPKWTEHWEKEDAIATLAVLGAAATVAFAVHMYKRSS